MSRAIDSLLRRIREQIQVRTGSHLPDTVTGKDGKQYPASRGPHPLWARVAEAARLRAKAEALRREADEALEASTRELLEAGVLLEALHGRARPH